VHYVPSAGEPYKHRTKTAVKISLKL
jgi:hypothetical protein